MICTFRYSLGRRSYMPSTIADLIINNYKLFNDNDWNRFIEEIEDEDYLGDSCDIQKWNEFIDFCKSKTKEANN